MAINWVCLPETDRFWKWDRISYCSLPNLHTNLKQVVYVYQFTFNYYPFWPYILFLFPTEHRCYDQLFSWYWHYSATEFIDKQIWPQDGLTYWGVDLNYENPDLDDVFYLQPFQLRFLIHIICHKPHVIHNHTWKCTCFNFIWKEWKC